MKALSHEEIQRKLAALEGWTFTPQGIRKRYEMGNFLSAMNLVKRVADLAESANHHPDIFISYDKVNIHTHNS